MKKRHLSIEEYENTPSAYTIIVSNARYQKDFSNNIERIIKKYLIDEEVFFGFYRTDGVNLTLGQQKELKHRIQDFLKKMVIYKTYANI